ncbi:MAG: prenyltransferase/squalene oxidase repeat-containing protein [Candidatus Thorarchaeota archaeon]
MTWLPLLLSESSAALRYLVLRDLLSRDNSDRELLELKELRLEEPIIVDLLNAQNEDGSWSTSDKLGLQLNNIRNTAKAMIRLGYLGFDKDNPAIKRAADYLFSQQLEKGAWPRNENGTLEYKHPNHGLIVTTLQTAAPLHALAYCGYATHKRSEKAFEWLIENRTEDGTWPTYQSLHGKIVYQVVGYRQMPNSRFGCRTNSTAALLAFANHPIRKSSDVAKRVLDLLLSRETRDRYNLGFEVARTIGIESSHGFLTHHGRFDLALILELCWKIGATLEDTRVKDLVNYIKESQGSYGIWEYLPNPKGSKWVTYDILRSLSKLDETGDWISTQPRTRYKSYPRKPKRF